jgi:hypothetical protein
MGALNGCGTRIYARLERQMSPSVACHEVVTTPTEPREMRCESATLLRQVSDTEAIPGHARKRQSTDCNPSANAYAGSNPAPAPEVKGFVAS